MPLTRFKLSSIGDGGITTAKLADGAVTLTKTDSLFVNTEISGTEAAKMPVGTTAQRANESSGDIRFNSTINLMEYYDGTAWKAIDAAPVVSSISPTTSFTANEDIVITGQGFSSGATVKFVGNDGTEYASPSVTFTSSTSITAQTPNTALTSGNEPYDIVVTNPSGLAGTGSDLLDAGGPPTWTTASGSLMGGTTMYEGEIIESLSVSATDPDGQTVTYSVTSGDALPAGLTLNSDGTITGDTDAVSGDTTTTFSIDATAGGETTARSFSMVTTNDESAAYASNLRLWIRAGHDGTTGNMSGLTATPAIYQGVFNSNTIYHITTPVVGINNDTASPVNGTTKIKEALGGDANFNTVALQNELYAYQCDSGDSFWIDVPPNDSLFDSSTTNHTFTYWMNWENRAANYGSDFLCPTFHSWSGTNAVAFIANDWYTGGTNNPRMMNYASNGLFGTWNMSSVSGGANGNKGVWYHVGLVYTSGQTLCYLNGVLDATLTGPTSWPTPGGLQSCNFHGRGDGYTGGVAGSTPGNYATGNGGYRSQADLRYYNTNLSAGAIADIYNKGRSTFV